MKLKFVGHICPECGEECYVSGHIEGFARQGYEADGWLGFYYWTCCYRCHSGYLLLFDQDRRFIGIVPNGHDESAVTVMSGTLYLAGRREPEFDEIPF